ncbi:hypothetical protein MXB_2351 [Myxobolus squamalis]|nr:hypothetical protein MXB_2351 [Myxobolus squamalis]
MEESKPEQTPSRRRKDKANKVKNRAPAPVQITAEQLLREARERQNERIPAAPRQKVIDGEEMDSLKLKKRKEYEDNIKKVFERALDTDYRVVSLWLKYVEMEMRHRQINHARNVFDRAVTLLPRANQFWYKYTYMEELMENISGARNVFERWMEWRPDEQAWLSFIKMELRYKEVNRARSIYERFVTVHPDVQNWIRFARFEENHSNIANARLVYERAVEFFGETELDSKLIVAFARFEESCREYERARTIYKFAIDKLCGKDNHEYGKFEKRHGDRRDVEDVNIATNQFDYDSWFDLISILENEIGDPAEIRDCYEKAVAAIPPAQDFLRARQVYKSCLNIIPHKSFTFSKIWIMFAEFEIRQKDISSARKILGNAVGKCPTEKLYRSYIGLETDFREFKRARILYEKFIEFCPTACVPWIKYAEMETLIGNVDRSRALYELAVSQENLNMPEFLWKSYIDFAISLGDYELVRDIYERLLIRTIHSKVWISFAQFEAGTDDQDCLERARSVFRRANETLKQAEEIEQRIHLVKTWKDFEDQYGEKDTLEEVKAILPRKVKKRRKIVDENGMETGWEEYFEYMFGDATSTLPNSKLLKMAHMWKAEQESKTT